LVGYCYWFVVGVQYFVCGVVGCYDYELVGWVEYGGWLFVFGCMMGDFVWCGGV